MSRFSARRIRRRINRGLYRLTFRLYRRIFPTPRWSGPLDGRSLRRILIIRDDRVGDMVLTTPLLSFLKEAAPQAELDVLASRANAPILQHDPRVTNVFVNDRTWRWWAANAARIRARQYDLIINPITRHPYRQGLVASALATRRTFKVSGWRPVRFQGLFTKAFRIPPRVTHMAELVLAVGQLTFRRREIVGRGSLDRYPICLAADDDADARVAAFLSAHRLDRVVVVNVSAGGPTRDWPPEHAAAVAADILERYEQLSVVVAPAPGKADQSADVGRRLRSDRAVISPVFPLSDLVALVRRARLVVTPDTALVHIASATKRPIVALFAVQHPNDVPLWLPVGVPYRVLASPLGGTVADITPHAVAASIDDLFTEVEPARQAGEIQR